MATQSSRPSKVKVSSTIRTETKTVVENDITETTTVTTTTDFYSDGTSSTRKEVSTSREEHVSLGPDGQPISQRPEDKSPAIAIPVPNVLASNIQQSVMTSSSENIPQDSGRNTNVASKTPGNVPQMQSVGTDAFEDQALRSHNKHRSKHNVPPLKLSKELCQAAQTWASHLADKGSMINSQYGYGENIYWTSANGQAMKGDVPVEYWYHEGNSYDWGNHEFQKQAGSFTQMVWRDSKEFGIGKSVGPRGTFVVAFYVPPGNVMGKFKDNVGKPAGMQVQVQSQTQTDGWNNRVK